MGQSFTICRLVLPGTDTILTKVGAPRGHRQSTMTEQKAQQGVEGEGGVPESKRVWKCPRCQKSGVIALLGRQKCASKAPEKDFSSGNRVWIDGKGCWVGQGVYGVMPSCNNFQGFDGGCGVVGGCYRRLGFQKKCRDGKEWPRNCKKADLKVDYTLFHPRITTKKLSQVSK